MHTDLVQKMGSSLSTQRKATLDRYKDKARRLLHLKPKTKTATTMAQQRPGGIWQQELQPLFDNHQCRTPVDEAYEGADCFEQWIRDNHARWEAGYHAIRLMAALDRHQRNPTMPKCMIEHAGSESSSSQAGMVEAPRGQLQDTHAAVRSTPGNGSPWPLR